MQACKTCKWWGDVLAGACGFVETLRASDPATQFEIGATADDESGLIVSLLTGPDFGCVHHTEMSDEQ